MPAWLAFSVIRLLEEHFPRQISYEFTAGMEDVLDEIAGGPQGPQHRARRVLLRLRAGAGAARRWSTSSARSTPASWRRSRSAAPDSGINLRVGRYGPYLEGPDDEGNPTGKRANVPDDLPPDELTLEKAKELFANPAGEEIELGDHPETGLRGRGEERPLRPLRHRGAARGRAQDRPSRAPARCSSRCRSTRSPSTTRSSCCRCRAWSAPTPRTARRSPPRTAATGPTSRRAPTPGR